MCVYPLEYIYIKSVYFAIVTFVAWKYYHTLSVQGLDGRYISYYYKVLC
jgi:hypothetical protein